MLRTLFRTTSALIPAALFAAALTATLAGCAAKPQPAPTPTAPSADQVQVLRETYKTAFPAAKVGVVSAVLPDEPYVLVNDLDTANLKEGDYVSFIDADQAVIASGNIVKVNPTSIAVQFDAGTRKPAVGDAAVKF